jgi:hypothetical protein
MKVNTYTEFSGKTIQEIRGCKKHSDEVTIKFTDGSCLKFYHKQDCCETVLLEDFDATPEDLVNAKIISIEERISNSNENEIKPLNTLDQSYTWSFYVIKTSKFTMTMRWYGESNGWYSETVDIDYLHYDNNGEFVRKTINL